MIPPVGITKPPVGESPMGFRPGDAARVATATKYVEQLARGGGPLPGRGMRGWSIFVRVAVAGSGGIPARDGATPGSAAVTFVQLVGGQLAQQTDSDATVTAYNLSAAAVQPGYLMLLWAEGVWWAGWEDCPAGSAPYGSGS